MLCCTTQTAAIVQRAITVQGGGSVRSGAHRRTVYNSLPLLGLTFNFFAVADTLTR